MTKKSPQVALVKNNTDITHETVTVNIDVVDMAAFNFMDLLEAMSQTLTFS